MRTRRTLDYGLNGDVVNLQGTCMLLGEPILCTIDCFKYNSSPAHCTFQGPVFYSAWNKFSMACQVDVRFPTRLKGGYRSRVYVTCSTR